MNLEDPKIVVIGPSYFETTQYVDGTLQADASHEAVDVESTVGGTGLNWALGLYRLGSNVSLVSCLGKDLNSSFIRDFLEKEQLPSYFIMNRLADTATTIVANGQKYVISQRHASNNFTLDDKVMEKIEISDVVMITTLHNDKVREIIEYAYKKGKIIALATNKRNSSHAHEIKSVLPYVSYMPLSSDELENLTTSSGYSISDLTSQGMLLSVTNGKQGSQIFYKDLVLPISVHKPEQPAIDANHCGEAYGSALFNYVLQRNPSLDLTEDDLLTAGHRASVAGYLNAMHKQDSLPRMEALETELSYDPIRRTG